MVDEERLFQKLDEINRNILKLTAVESLSGQDQKDRIKALSKIGFSSYEIEGMTGVPARTIRRIVTARTKVKG